MARLDDSSKKLAQLIDEAVLEADSWPEPADPLVGTTLSGRYEILSLIGVGGMGGVYKARDKRLGRVVAIKVMNVARMGLAPATMAILIKENLRRFEREAQAASRFDNEHVVRVFDLAQADQTSFFLVMEYVEGQNLKAIIQERGALTVREAVEVAVQCLEALEAVHGAGVIHRDLKPGNILLTESNGRPVVKICDFGIGKMTSGTPGCQAALDSTMTAAGTMVGTPEYMSPEQCRGETADCRSDLYALGIIIYQMLTGEPPFKNTGNALSLVSKHQLVPPPSMREAGALGAGIPAALEAVVMKALEKKPENRFQSASEMRAALVASVSAARRSRTVETVRNGGGGIKVAAAFVALAVLGGAGYLGFMKFQASSSVDAAPVAVKAPAAGVRSESVRGSHVLPPEEISLPGSRRAPAADRSGFQTAAEELERKIARNSADANLWYELGRTRSQLRQNDKAAEAYRKFLKLAGRKDGGKVRFVKAWLKRNGG